MSTTEWDDVYAGLAHMVLREDFPELPAKYVALAIDRSSRKTHRSPLLELLDVEELDGTFTLKTATELVARVTKVPFIDLSNPRAETDVAPIQQGGLELFAGRECVPVTFEGRQYLVAVTVSRALNTVVKRGYAETDKPELALGYLPEVLARIERVRNEFVLTGDQADDTQPEAVSEPAIDRGSVQRVAVEDTGNVAFVRDTIEKAASQRASDLHLALDETGRLIIRMRIDGVVRQMVSQNTGNGRRLIQSAMSHANMDIGLQNEPQSTKFEHVTTNGRRLDIRSEMLPTRTGPKLTWRLLDSVNSIMRIDDMGLAPATAETLKREMGKASGMVITTGPTGSGKALALSTPVPTPNGTTTMGALHHGDRVLGRDGRPCTVEHVWEVNDTPELFRVTFADGQTIVADADHQWLVADHWGRNAPRTAKRIRAVAAYEEAHAVADELDDSAGRWNGTESLSVADLYEVVVRHGLDSHFPSPTMVRRALQSTDCPIDREMVRGGRGGHTQPALYPAAVALKSMALRLRQRYSTRPVDEAVLYRLTTGEMLANGLTTNCGQAQYAVPAPAPLQLPTAELLVDPYLLGYWLGDGTTGSGTITVGDQDLIAARDLLSASRPVTHTLRTNSAWRLSFGRPAPNLCYRGHDDWTSATTQTYCSTCRRAGGKDDPIVNGDLGAQLGVIGVIDDKHIPTTYLRASLEQRTALLQGLMDSDGTVDVDGACELSLSDRRLAGDALALIRTLGIRATITWDARSGCTAEDGTVVDGVRHRINFTPDTPVFRLLRKAERQAVRVEQGVSERSKWIPITDITPISPGDAGYEPARCITVDSPDRTYLAGDGLVPTSNTSTMYALLQERTGSGEEIITIEDPIEYKLAGITQVQVDPKSRRGVKWHNAIKSALRSDPDVILIGEMRDPDTAQTGVQAAMTGHLVLSTLHTTSALGVFARLLDLGVEPFLAGDQVRVAIGQRLVRRIHRDCATTEYLDARTIELLEAAGIKDVTQAPAPGGCDLCGRTGYKGRSALMELLVVNSAIQDAVRFGGGSEVAIREAANEDNYVPFHVDAKRLITEGITSPSEVLPLLTSTDAGLWRPGGEDVTALVPVEDAQAS